MRLCLSGTPGTQRWRGRKALLESDPVDESTRGGGTCEPPGDVRAGASSPVLSCPVPRTSETLGGMWKAWTNLGGAAVRPAPECCPVANGGLCKHGADNKRGPVVAEGGGGGGQRGAEILSGAGRGTSGFPSSEHEASASPLEA